MKINFGSESLIKGLAFVLLLFSAQLSFAASPTAVSQNISCNPNITGVSVTSCAITLSASGGTAPLTYTVVTNPSNGTLSGTAPNLIYTPNTDYWGTDSFTFQATDSLGNVSAAATINIVDAVIVDTDNSQDFTASYNGSSCSSSWYVSHSNWGSFFWGNSFLSNNSYPNATACHGPNEYVTFTATIPENGIYDVYMAVPAGYGSAAASNAPVTINSYYGASSNPQTTTMTINEQGGGWVHIGRFPYNAQQQAIVNLGTYSSTTGDGTGYILANAIKYSYIKPVPTSVPPQPTGLSATLLWESAELSWPTVDASSDGIYLEESTDGINFTPIVDPLNLQPQPLPTNQVLYYSPALSAGTTYYFRMRTFNMMGYSPYSPTVTVTTPPAATSLIPADRIVDWSQVGVPGGIPNRTTICANVTQAPYNADNTGVNDAGPAIQLAISGNPHSNPPVPKCPANEVVYIPAGTYLIKTPIGVLAQNDGNINAANPITIRGDGPGRTILVDDKTSGQAMIEFGDENASSPSPITSGYSKGSNTITVSSTSGVQPGMLLKIFENNDPTFVFSTKNFQNMLRQTVYVTGVTPTTITFTPSLYWTYAPSLNPSYEYITPVVTFSGIEDMTISHPTGTGLLNSTYFDGTYGCWIKNVESDNDSSYHFLFTNDVSGELQGLYINNEQGGGMDHGGIIFYQNVDNYLVDDNIIEKVFPGIENSSGSSGNVFSYNFSDNVQTGQGMLGADFDTNHGPHTMMNLWEGNRGVMFQSDAYFGSASHTTVFRNWLTGTNSNNSVIIGASVYAGGTGYQVGDVLSITESGASGGTVTVSGVGTGGVITGVTLTTGGNGYISGGPYTTTALTGVGTGAKVNLTTNNQNRKTISLNRWSYYFNVVGNILGVPSFNNGSVLGIYDITIPYGYNQPVIYQIGYPDMGNDGYSGTNPPVNEPPTFNADSNGNGDPEALDLEVRATLLRHDNFDYATNTINLDPNISDQVSLPTSLYLTVKPSFLGSKPWPLIGPDVAGYVAADLTAQDRYNVISAPLVNGADVTAPTIPFGLTGSVNGAQVSLSWEMSWDNVGVAGYKVYRDGVSLASVDNTQHMNTQYVDPGVSLGNHNYTVSAYDAAGNESGQSVATVVTVGGQNTYSLTINTNGNGYGAVTSVSPVINCGIDGATPPCSVNVNAGSTVILTATALSSPASSFTGWSGACSGTAINCTLVMNAVRNVTATFSSTMINGVCGSADQTYLYNATGFGSNTLCRSGNPSPAIVSFPLPGAKTTWTCLGSDNGFNSSCSAKRNSRAILRLN